MWLKFKLWMIETALRHHFRGTGDNFRAVVETAQVSPRRAQIAVWALANSGITWPAHETYPDEEQRRWFHGLTNELLRLLPIYFDGLPNMALRALAAGAVAMTFAPFVGFIGALLIGVFISGPGTLLTAYGFYHRRTRLLAEAAS